MRVPTFPACAAPNGSNGARRTAWALTVTRSAHERDAAPTRWRFGLLSRARLTTNPAGFRLVLVVVFALALHAVSLAQVAHVRSPERLSFRSLAANVIIPQRRVVAPLRPGSGGTVTIERVDARVSIVEQVAATTLDIALRNPTDRRLEAEVILPVPEGAAVRGFDFQGAGAEPAAQLLPKEEARRIYDEIVARTRDPALLEFIDFHLIRSSVFPVEPHGTQTIRLTYEHVCPADGDRIDYVLPRSESLDYAVPWDVRVTVKSQRKLATVYSPSHGTETRITHEGRGASARLATGAEREPGSFRLSLLLADGDGPSATLLAYPDPKVGGGYFLLLAGVPHDPASARRRIQREITLVLDRSGSMAGDKLNQVRTAAQQILAGLEPGESFNIIAYNEAVEVFSQRPIIKNAANTAAAGRYLQGVQARGGTNIHDAVVEALRQEPTQDRLPIVLFLTDGRPTIGQTSEKAIRDAAEAANTHGKRVFTFGVGVDVNSPLLEHLAFQTRATAAFVLPGEDIELKVSQVFQRLSGPVLAEPQLTVLDGDGDPAVGRTRGLIPTRLPDLFDGDQLTLLGQYMGEQPLAFRLTGQYLGRKRSFQFRFGLDKATTRNSFVPRLWAQRKIAVLVDAIRTSGADPRAVAAGNPDPRIQELVDEIVRLSTEFGVLTEYTAFLAREGTDLTQREQVAAEAWRNFDTRARQVRSGLDSVNQELNSQSQKSTSQLNYRNAYWDANMDRAQVASVQQVADRAFYQKAGRWVDSRLVDQADAGREQRVIEFGSKEYLELAHRLARENRQGSIMMRGEILLLIDGQMILIRNN